MTSTSKIKRVTVRRSSRKVSFHDIDYTWARQSWIKCIDVTRYVLILCLCYIIEIYVNLNPWIIDPAICSHFILQSGNTSIIWHILVPLKNLS